MISRFLLVVLLIAANAAQAAKPAAPSDNEFIRAVDSANEVQVKRFLDQGANPNAIDDRGEPALIYALHAEKFETADVLAAWPGTNLEAENKQGETALMVAAYLGRREMVERLLARGAEVSHSGWTALHFAASSGQLEIVRILLEHSAYIDALSDNGTTPLMMAARHRDAEVSALLLEQGADPTPVNGAGLSAADFARKAGDQPLAKSLEQARLSWVSQHTTPVLPAPSAVTPLPAAPEQPAGHS